MSIDCITLLLWVLTKVWLSMVAGKRAVLEFIVRHYGSHVHGGKDGCPPPFLHHIGCELANEYKLIHSVNHSLRSYSIPGLVVAAEYTKDKYTQVKPLPSGTLCSSSGHKPRWTMSAGENSIKKNKAKEAESDVVER